jgi:hypothetical protein
VSPFGGRAFVAVAVWLGLAALDLGPRASAAFWVTLSPPSCAGTADDLALGGMGSAGPTEPGDHRHVWPPAPDRGEIVHWAFPAPQGSSPGGAGSPSGPSSNSSGPPPVAAATADPPTPALVVPLRVAVRLLTSQFDISSIFEPPRFGAH